jgi:hypothetical protein
MNTRAYTIGKAGESEDFAKSHHDQAPFIMDLGTVSKETKTDSLPIALDSGNHPGTMGA